MVVDREGAAVAFDGQHWGELQVIDPGSSSAGPQALASVTCPTNQFCAAVDAAGRALTFDGNQSSAAVQVDAGGGDADVDCVSSEFCVATDGVGQAAIYRG